MTHDKKTTRSDARLYRRLLGLAILLPACPGERPAGSGGPCCSEGEWTTSADVAKAYASKDARETLGCPSKIVGADKVPNALLPPDASPPPADYGALDLLEGPTQKLRANGDATCVYRTVACCPGGRPLYAADENRAIVASRTRGAAWSRRALAPLGQSLAPEERAHIARGWLEDALVEHASVASFARATLELVAVGAPPSLLAAHQRAAIQEIHHAERCFALARAYGDHAIDPGPIAIPSPRAGDLARLACDTFVEGCVAETIGALLASRALDACTVREPRAALRIIATDEAAHAALAWKTLAWASNGGERVVGAVLERADALRAEQMRRQSVGPRRGSAEFHAHGRLDDDDINRATHDAWRFVIDPLLAKLRATSSSV